MMFSVVKTLVPQGIKHRIRLEIQNYIRKLKAPRMLWGYQNPGGEWCARTRISDTASIYQPEKVVIDDNVYVGHFCILDGTSGIHVGEGTMLSSWAGVYTHSSHVAIRLYGKHYQEVPEEEKVGYKRLPVSIGKYVFVGVGAKILPGVSIEDGALVAAGAVVNRPVGAFEFVAGNPAVVVGDTRKLDEKYLDSDPWLKTWYEEWQK